MIAEPAVPGWRLTLDGQRADRLLTRADGYFLGLLLPAYGFQVVVLYRLGGHSFDLLQHRLAMVFELFAQDVQLTMLFLAEFFLFCVLNQVIQLFQ